MTDRLCPRDADGKPITRACKVCGATMDVFIHYALPGVAVAICEGCRLRHLARYEPPEPDDGLRRTLRMTFDREPFRPIITSSMSVLIRAVGDEDEPPPPS
jgi:hypothetical protein